MKLLVDANLSPRLADRLREVGYEAVHVVEVGLMTADDVEILERALAAGEVIVTADADFGALLALSGRPGPSTVLLRSSDHLSSSAQAELVLLALDHARDDLETGAVVSVMPGRLRIRTLPVGTTPPGESVD